jgi:long-chain fatty acid transport protein
MFFNQLKNQLKQGTSMKTRQIAISIALLLGAPAAFATDGYFTHGVGVRAQGIGGAGIALPQDGLAAATNPAGTVFLEDRADVGVTLFRPSRSATITGNAGVGLGSADGSYDGNGTNNFYLPEFGLIKHLDKVTTGVAVYGNGGMNTYYSKNPYAAFGNTGGAGVNIEQLFITPSVAYKLDEKNALGVALNFAYQRFSADGLGAFGGYSANPGNVSNKGTDTSTGWGLRFGWTGNVSPDLTFGLTYATKIKAGKFSNYSGLFADGGSFDIPANYGVGLAYKATSQFTLAVDLEKILYSGVSSVANPLSNLFSGNQFGTVNGPGFGWKDVTVFKLGGNYALSDSLTVRAGYNHTDQPVPNDQVFLNILAPAVIQDHLTLGATWKAAGGEISAAYSHGFKKTVTGAIPSAFGGGNASINLEEDILGLAYSWKI